MTHSRTKHSKRLLSHSSSHLPMPSFFCNTTAIHVFFMAISTVSTLKATSRPSRPPAAGHFRILLLLANYMHMVSRKITLTTLLALDGSDTEPWTENGGARS